MYSFIKRHQDHRRSRGANSLRADRLQPEGNENLAPNRSLSFV